MQVSVNKAFERAGSTKRIAPTCQMQEDEHDFDASEIFGM